jgi:hypothetical protein
MNKLLVYLVFTQSPLLMIGKFSNEKMKFKYRGTQMLIFFQYDSLF